MPPAMHERIAARLTEAGASFTLHEHPPVRTVEEARAALPFPYDSFLKTVALRIKDGPLVLAALRGGDRLDYRALAAALGVRRADLRPLSPQEVRQAFGVEPGGVGPLLPGTNARVVIDQAGAALPAVYCGAGHPERTLEIAPHELVRVTAAGVAPLAAVPQEGEREG